MATITFQYKFRVGGELTDATSVLLSDASGTYGAKRLDNDEVVVADGVAMTHVSTGVYETTITTPSPGLTYSWVAEVLYAGATSWLEQESTDPNDNEDASGTYWTWQGIKEQLGRKNANIASDLDNDQEPQTAEPDMDRVIADGTAADAYTNFRAERGLRPYRTSDLDVDLNIPTTYRHFALVRLAANLYASYLLCVHRIWEPPGTDEDRQRSRDDLYNRAMSMYDQLFGGINPADPNAVAPGTLQTVDLVFEAECDCDEFSDNC